MPEAILTKYGLCVNCAPRAFAVEHPRQNLAIAARKPLWFMASKEQVAGKKGYADLLAEVVSTTKPELEARTLCGGCRTLELERNPSGCCLNSNEEPGLAADICLPAFVCCIIEIFFPKPIRSAIQFPSF